MHRNFEKRINPSELLENAQSIIVVGLNYNVREKLEYNRSPQTAKIASYACYEDYHTFIKKLLHELADFISTQAKQNLHFKICVDSVPLAERALALKAGLGFIGKNHMIINQELGCKLFLGEIITDLKLEPDSQSRLRYIASDKLSLCSKCNKCIKVCPTGALRPDGFLDASRCFNYLTIEYKDEIPDELAEKIGDRLFGCEECINICPYQKNAPVCKNKKFSFHPDRAQINPQEILAMNEELFEQKFYDSVVLRTGIENLKRNARICNANRISS